MGLDDGWGKVFLVAWGSMLAHGDTRETLTTCPEAGGEWVVVLEAGGLAWGLRWGAPDVE